MRTAVSHSTRVLVATRLLLLRPVCTALAAPRPLASSAATGAGVCRSPAFYPRRLVCSSSATMDASTEPQITGGNPLLTVS